MAYDDDGDEESVDDDLWQKGYEAEHEDGPYLDDGLPNPAYDPCRDDD